MDELLFKKRPIQSYFRSNSLSELIDVSTFLGEEIEYFKLNMINVSERVRLRTYQYWLSVLQKRIKEVEKRRRQATKVANLKRQNASSDPVLKAVIAVTKALGGSNRQKPENSGRKSFDENIKKQLPHDPDAPVLTYEQIKDNMTARWKMGLILDSDYRANMRTLYWVYEQGYSQIDAVKKVEEEACSPNNDVLLNIIPGSTDPNKYLMRNRISHDVIDPAEYTKEDGTEMNILEFMDSQYAKRPKPEPLYWCKTLKEHEYDIHMERLENDSVYAEEHFQRKQAEAKQNAEDQRVKNLEWEREQTIKRKAEKLISDMKTREQVKCLIPEKSSVESVEEQLDNTEA